MIHPVISFLLLMALAPETKRIDPLWVEEEPGGGSILVDILVGSSTRLVCIQPKLTDRCDLESADVVVRQAPRPDAVQTRWVRRGVVGVLVAGGELKRAAGQARRGGVQIRLTQDEKAFWRD